MLLVSIDGVFLAESVHLLVYLFCLGVIKDDVRDVKYVRYVIGVIGVISLISLISVILHVYVCVCVRTFSSVSPIKSAIWGRVG